jgi:hypothetical protein
MDKKIAGLLGAVAALGAVNTAQATPPPAPTDPLKADSYADLLEPIPNALKVLQALDEQSPVKPTGAAVKVAQYYHHHHHHHHHGYWHHHHHHGYYGPRVYVVPPRRYYHHHHHHHHHHHGYWNRW